MYCGRRWGRDARDRARRGVEGQRLFTSRVRCHDGRSVGSRAFRIVLGQVLLLSRPVKRRRGRPVSNGEDPHEDGVAVRERGRGIRRRGGNASCR